MADTVLKSVRIRAKRSDTMLKKPSKPGANDGRLVLSSQGKDRVVNVYLGDSNNEYPDFLLSSGLTFFKKDWKDKSDDEVIKAYLEVYPKFSLIQDPYDATNVPTDPDYEPTPAGATSSSGVTASVAGVTASNTGTASTSDLASAPVTSPPVNKFITGKVKITKKSGPGELTGETEIELTDPNNTGTTSATFKDLQFTEGGDYVLSITSTSTEVEPMELKIKVLKQDDIIEQPVSRGNEGDKKPVDGNRPIIAQIDKPTIVVPAIKMDQDVAGPQGQDQYTKGMGYTPLIWYKGIAIEDRLLKTLRLYHEGIVPKIEFTFEESKEVMKGIATPTDDSTIDFFLNSTSKNLKSIHMVFKMESFTQLPAKTNQMYKVIGTVNIPGLYVPNNKTYKETSFNTLKTICKELGIGFNSNITDTKDNMSWRNTFMKPHQFMEDIISRSYISDEAFTGGYIDYYYCFNYVDIEKEMNRDASGDVGINTSGLSEQTTPDESLRVIPLKLTTDDGQSSSCLYISKYEKINDSTKKSLKEGYATVTKFYDRIKKQFLVFTVDSTTSDGSKSIILKGSEKDDKYKNENIKHKFMGKLDTDNVHQDYNYAATQNRINLNNLNKIALKVTLPNANWNLYKFQKVDVNIINAASTIANPSIMDYRYSGYYIIADIEYFWSNRKMSQNLRLVRKELGKTPDEIKNDPPQKPKPEVKENNPNPVPGATSSVVPAPNSVYNVGQVYLVQDKQGNKYELTVTTISPNGIEIKGTLKSIKTDTTTKTN